MLVLVSQRYFIHLARAGSVRQCGRTLGISHSTVLRRIRALEEAAGVELRAGARPPGAVRPFASPKMRHASLPQPEPERLRAQRNPVPLR